MREPRFGPASASLAVSPFIQECISRRTQYQSTQVRHSTVPALVVRRRPDTLFPHDKSSLNGVGISPLADLDPSTVFSVFFFVILPVSFTSDPHPQPLPARGRSARAALPQPEPRPVRRARSGAAAQSHRSRADVPSRRSPSVTASTACRSPWTKTPPCRSSALQGAARALSFTSARTSSRRRTAILRSTDVRSAARAPFAA